MKYLKIIKELNLEKVYFILASKLINIINFYLKLDLKKLYSQAGISNKETTFILVDTQVVDETFFEDINNILSSGEVPNLYKTEELEEVLD